MSELYEAEDTVDKATMLIDIRRLAWVELST